jgi:hypothetical protein
MGNQTIVPPGDHPFDPHNKDIDPIGFALERLQTYLTWIEEHRASFQVSRTSDPESAAKELCYLAYCTKEALRHFERLTELLLAGNVIDSNKRLPNSLFQPAWLSWVNKLLSEEKGEKTESRK